MARPKGSHNVKDVQHVEALRCTCGTTDIKTLSTDVQEYAGLTVDGERISWEGNGKPFNRVVRRRVQCQSCSRVWIVKTLEFVPDPTATE